MGTLSSHRDSPCSDTILTKGTTAHFLRIFPHTVVTLVANEVGLGFLTWPETRNSPQVIMNQYRSFRGDYKVAEVK